MVTKVSRRPEGRRIELFPSSEKPDIDDMRDWLGLTQEEVAKSVRRSRRTVARWSPTAPDHTEARGETASEVRKLGRLKFILEDLVDRQEAQRWLRVPNREFNGEAPIDLILSRRIDRVIAALQAFAEGGTG